MTYSYCPECNNKYKSYEFCPECAVPLQIPNMNPNQHVDGDHNQSIQIGGDNHGQVVNGPATFHQQIEGRETADYNTKLDRTYSSLSEMARPAILNSIGAAGIGLLQWFGAWASLLSFFGFSAPLLGIGQMVIIVFALAIAIPAGFRLYDTIQLIGNTWFRRFSNLYIKKEDGSIEALRVSGKCPIAGCPGTLYLGKPFANEQGVEFAAICSKHGGYHAFEFNDETYKGSRIMLIPLKTNK